MNIVNPQKNLLLNEQGESLIEVIVSMLILAMFVLFYVSSTTTSFTATNIYGKKTVAVNYAKEKLEEIKSFTTYTAFNTAFTSKKTGFCDTNHVYSYEVIYVAPVGNMCDIKVTVSYPVKGVTQSVVLETKIFWET